MRSPLLLCLSACMITGCAGYKLTPISPRDAAAAHASEAGREGYIFHAPKPYLVGARKAGTDDAEFTYAIEYLPDFERPFRFERYEFLAKSDLKIGFEHGWKFTGADSQTDSTAGLAALAGLAEKVLAMGPDNAPDSSLVIFEIGARDGAPFLNQVYPTKPLAPNGGTQ